MRRIVLPLMMIIVLGIISCRKPQAFQYRDIKNIKVNNFGLAQSNVSLDLMFYNPNSYGVNLKNVNCSIYIDSSLAGQYVLDTLMHIPGSADFTLPVSLDVDMKSVFKNSLNLLFTNEVLIGASGTTRVGKGGIYVTVPFNYEGKQKLNLF